MEALQASHVVCHSSQSTEELPAKCCFHPSQEELGLLQLALEFRDTSTELQEKLNSKEPVYLLVLKEPTLKYDKLTASSLVSKSAHH